MVAEPNWFAAGVIVRTRLAPEPPRSRLPVGVKVGLEEDAVTFRAAAGLSASLTWMLTTLATLAVVVWSAIAPTVGAVFTTETSVGANSGSLVTTKRSRTLWVSRARKTI